MALAAIDDDRDRRDALLEPYSTLDSSFEHLTLVDTAGRLITTTGDIPANAELRQRGIADRPYFQQALRSRTHDGLAGRHFAQRRLPAGHGDRHPVLQWSPATRSVPSAVCCGSKRSTRWSTRNDVLPDAHVTIVDEFGKVIYASARGRARRGRTRGTAARGRRERHV